MFKYFVILLSLTMPTVNYAYANMYGGVSADYGLPHSGSERLHASIILGTRIESGVYSYGGELDIGTSIDNTVDYTTFRTRFLLGLPQKTFEPVFGLGNTIYIDNGSSYSSVNISGGIELAYSDKSLLRFEAIRDFNASHTTPVTVIRFAILVPF